MTTQPPNPITLTERWEAHTISQKTDLRAKLIDAVARHEGWEESAIAMVDEAIMPVLKGNYRAPDTSLIAVIEEFGQDRYWQPGWAEELAERIATMGGVPLGLPSGEPTAAVTPPANIEATYGLNNGLYYIDEIPSREYEDHTSEIPVVDPLGLSPDERLAHDLNVLALDCIDGEPISRQHIHTLCTQAAQRIVASREPVMVGLVSLTELEERLDVFSGYIKAVLDELGVKYVD